MKYNVQLERCKRSDPRYQAIRDRHYVPNHGCIGQQIHYLITLDGEVVGIISGASAVFGVKSRDNYFGLTPQNKRAGLPSIVDNVVYRLEAHKPNLATQVLAMWRKQICIDWEERYKVKVHGFETFVIENDVRKGTLYKADNWDFVGITAGSTKTHKGIATPAKRIATEQKLVSCKKVPNTELSTEYHATWRGREEK